MVSFFKHRGTGKLIVNSGSTNASRLSRFGQLHSQAPRTDVVIQFASIPERMPAKIDVEILEAGKRRSYSYSGQNCADRRVFFE